jgi:hypothetical protein
MKHSFEPRRGPIIVTAHIAGPKGLRAVRLALDTGSTMTSLSSDVLDIIGAQPIVGGPMTEVITVSGKAEIPSSELTYLTALGKSRLHFSVLAINFSEDAEFDGLLGLDFLRGSVAVLDFVRGRLWLD